MQEIANNSPQAQHLAQLRAVASQGSSQPAQPVNGATQLLAVGRTLNPKTHPFFNSGNYQFATIESGRTPSYYFFDGANWRRMRTQHDSGPALIRPRPRQQFFFATKPELQAMSDHVNSTGSPVGFKGTQLPGPKQGAFHGEFSPGSGTFHRSGGTIDLSAPPSDADFAAMAAALEQAPEKIKKTDSAVQL